jgi:hypothetical protein
VRTNNLVDDGDAAVLVAVVDLLGRSEAIDIEAILKFEISMVLPNIS